MTKVFIDTNIFLGLYESNEDTLEIFKDIEKLESKLVFSRQVYDEFLRNRDQILRKLRHDIKTVNKIGMHSTSLIKSVTEYEQLKKIKVDFNTINQLLIQNVEEMTVDSSKDPIFSQFIRLYNSTSVMRIEKSETLIQRAFFRKLAGNPPISSKKDTIGDEIIWESLLEHITDDLILISRDNTYKKYSTFLINEYRNKTGKSLSITETLSEALKCVGEEPSDKLVQFEEEQKKSIYSVASAMDDTLERLGSLAETMNKLHIAGLDSIVDAMNRSHTALGSIIEAMNRSYATSYTASLDSIAETMGRSCAGVSTSLAKAMESPPVIGPSKIIETTDALVGRYNDLPTKCDPDTSRWLERDVNEDQEECIPDKPSRKEDHTNKGA